MSYLILWKFGCFLLLRLSTFKRFDNQIYPEIDLLASLYTGFNGKSLTQQTLQEINERLAKFPASSLATKSKNPSLNKLRQKLTELDLHTEFMAVLARKYNLQNPNSTEKIENGHKIPLNEEIGHILPETVGSSESLFEQTLPISGELESKISKQ